MQAFLIAMIILLYTFQSLFSKLYTDSYPGEARHAPAVFTVISGVTVAVISLFFSRFSFGQFRWETLLLGLINAVILYVYDKSIILASGNGPYSIMMVFSLGGGIIIPAIFTVLAFGDTFYWLKAVAIVAICIAVYMVSYKEADSEEKRGAMYKFILLCAVLALANGMYGVLLDAQSRWTGEADKQLMVIYTFIGAAIISGAELCLTAKDKILKAFVQTKKSFVYLLLASFVAALAVNILVLVLGVVDTAVLYTFDNAGVMLLSALASALIFKDKLTRLNVTGCVIMTVALILVGGADFIQPWIEGLFK